MTRLAAELNDAGVAIVNNGVDRPHLSPGIALLDGDTIHTGIPAARQSRLKPRHVHDRFWQDLDQQPLRRPFPSHLSTADLAHAQLSRLWQEHGAGVDGVVLAIPGSFDSAQLGLLLSVARAAGMPVTGLVDAALAAIVDRHTGATMLHLELQLHRAVLTTVSCGDDLERRSVERVDDIGISPLHGGWAKLVAGIFVRSTRFDPLHDAVTDQSLYDHLPTWLDTLCRRESVTATLVSAGREYSVELTRAQLVDAAAAEYRRLVEVLRDRALPSLLLLGPRAASLPGLAGRIADEIGVETVALRDDAAASGALHRTADIESTGDALPFVTRLPLTAGSQRAAVTRPTATPAIDGRPPTHILFNARAYPISDDPLHIGTAAPGEGRRLEIAGATAGISRDHCTVCHRGGVVEVEDHSRHGSFVNGRPIDGKMTLTAGDRVRLGTPGVELELIVVEVE